MLQALSEYKVRSGVRLGEALNLPKPWTKQIRSKSCLPPRDKVRSLTPVTSKRQLLLEEKYKTQLSSHFTDTRQCSIHHMEDRKLAHAQMLQRYKAEICCSWEMVTHLYPELPTDIR